MTEPRAVIEQQTATRCPTCGSEEVLDTEVTWYAQSLEPSDVMTESRQLFQQALERFQALPKERTEIEQRFQAELQRVADAEAPLPKRKRKNPPTLYERLSDARFEEIKRPYQEEAKRFFEREALLKDELSRLAPLAEVRPGELRVSLFDSWHSTYASTCNGPGYARALAEIHARSVPKEIKTEIVEEPAFVPSSNLFVFVAEPVDVEILKRRPGVDMRTFVKECWKRGLQPRVFQPFLPHNFEAMAGIDYQGRDVRKDKP